MRDRLQPQHEANNDAQSERSPEQLHDLVQIFINRLITLNFSYLAAYSPDVTYCDFDGRVQVEDDIDAVATNDKELGEAIFTLIVTQFPSPSEFIESCLYSLRVFLDATEEDERAALFESYIDQSRVAIATWAHEHGMEVGKRGPLSPALVEAYEHAMRQKVRAMRRETLREFSALKAVRGD